MQIRATQIRARRLINHRLVPTPLVKAIAILATSAGLRRSRSEDRQQVHNLDRQASRATAVAAARNRVTNKTAGKTPRKPTKEQEATRPQALRVRIQLRRDPRMLSRVGLRPRTTGRPVTGLPMTGLLMTKPRADNLPAIRRRVSPASRETVSPMHRLTRLPARVPKRPRRKLPEAIPRRPNPIRGRGPRAAVPHRTTHPRGANRGNPMRQPAHPQAVRGMGASKTIQPCNRRSLPILSTLSTRRRQRTSSWTTSIKPVRLPIPNCWRSCSGARMICGVSPNVGNRFATCPSSLACREIATSKRRSKASACVQREAGPARIVSRATHYAAFVTRAIANHLLQHSATRLMRFVRGGPAAVIVARLDVASLCSRRECFSFASDLDCGILFLTQVRRELHDRQIQSNPVSRRLACLAP